mgnify:CR=1 FL=1
MEKFNANRYIDPKALSNFDFATHLQKTDPEAFHRALSTHEGRIAFEDGQVLAGMNEYARNSYKAQMSALRQVAPEVVPVVENMNIHDRISFLHDAQVTDVYNAKFTDTDIQHMRETMYQASTRKFANGPLVYPGIQEAMDAKNQVTQKTFTEKQTLNDTTYKDVQSNTQNNNVATKGADKAIATKGAANKRTKLTWDCDTMSAKATVLLQAAEELTSVKRLYLQMQESIKESWQGKAADVFLNEMCLDVNAVEQVTNNIRLLAETLKGLTGIYNRCETDVTSTIDKATGIMNEMDIKMD